MWGTTLNTRGGRVLALFTVGMVASALVACSNQNASTPRPAIVPSSGAAAPSTGPSAVDQAGQSAVTAYRGMWNDFVDAAATSDWQSPKLGQYATGLALSTLSRGLYADHTNHVISKGSPTHDVSVTSVSPTKVMVTDCSDSTNTSQYDAASGRPADSAPGGRRQINATVEKQADGTWKVADFGVQAVGTC